ncbi:hypothetical protein [Pseudomonas cannabina]|uniref:Plasmid stability/partitioning protein n=1 Tax=Pseudomonas cannabina TaxID=86840 RepID=A0A0P9LLZ9_PSECA|nr:hypothetical protein [Pseudomonas cannabina]KAA8697186.1 hypothetical protein F4W70_28510 [Pseudomonas cannabina]KPW70700.1 hypothetical protein ALO81_200017 [Pseudomonas cannabina]SDR54555.1 hypothetical protein SAMN05216597_5710 [Pseudomonas cannabina]
MTTQTAADIDVFASPAPKAGVAQPEPDSKQEQEPLQKRNQNSFVEKVKPWHFFVVLALIAAVWIFAPKLFRSNSTVTQGQQFGAQNTKADYGAYERQKPVQPVEEPANTIPPVSQQVELIQVQGQLETFSKITSELQSQVRELQSQVPELQAKIAMLESRPTDNTSKTKERIQATRNQPAVPAVTTSKALTGYSINTIYTDQAWLAHDQRTIVVQVGDAFDGIRVLRIDPVSRQVVTNLGVIR